ncbi:MAG: cupin domain-containing protein [Phycisphaerales bacterium JB037]
MPATIQTPVDRHLHVMGTEVEVLLSAEQTRGACSMTRIAVPGNWAVVPHLHLYEDEIFHVLTGEIDVTVAGVTTRVPAGHSAFAPRLQPHQFRTPTAAPANILVTTTPGGIEHFFAACDRAFPRNTEPDLALAADLIERFGMRIAAD